MEFRKSRWVDDNGEKYDEHRHSHYNWHFVHTKHRPLRLDVDYPEVNKMMRSSSYISLRLFAPFLADRFDEEYSVDKIGGMADKRGGPLEIYLDNLLEDAAQIGHIHWDWDVFDSEKYDDDLRDLLSMALFNFCHDCYYTHEILHRMWQWETSHKQNRKRDRDKEEEIVSVISYAINTQHYGQLFDASLDASWERYKGMLREVGT